VLRHLCADQLVGALVDGLQANHTPDELAAVKAQTDQLVATMKAFNELREEDLVMLDFVNGDTKIGFNGEARGVIAGERFNRALMRIWLGDKPVQTDLRKALLGG
jgi:long-chain acyl-CoA synthetase